MKPRTEHLSDSPWFWFFLFGGMALAAAFIIGPKHELRQARLERMKDTRQKVAQGVRPTEADVKTEKARPTPPEPATKLPERLLNFLAAAWPLKLFLAIVLSIGAIVKIIVERRSQM